MLMISLCITLCVALLFIALSIGAAWLAWWALYMILGWNLIFTWIIMVLLVLLTMSLVLSRFTSYLEMVASKTVAKREETAGAVRSITNGLNLQMDTVENKTEFGIRYFEGYVDALKDVSNTIDKGAS